MAMQLGFIPVASLVECGDEHDHQKNDTGKLESAILGVRADCKHDQCSDQQGDRGRSDLSEVHAAFSPQDWIHGW